MEYSAPSITLQWPLQRVVAQLQAHEEVEGLLYIGSLAKHSLTPASDYDLVIVLRNALQPWSVGVTNIDGRFTDLIFVAASALSSVQLLAEPVSFDHEFAPIIRWLRNGVIVFDRTGHIQDAQRNVQQGEWIQSQGDHAAYSAWFAINYNLVVAQRLAASADTLYHTTAYIRMNVYGHMDVWLGYFTIRKLPWDGDKTAVRYLLEQDLPFLEAYQQFITTMTLEQKLLHYEQAAQRATAPLGGVWPPKRTVMNNPEAFQSWQALLAEHR